jgi:hypothetical protein
MSNGIKITDAPDNVKPRCPHCQLELDEMWVKSKGLGIVEQQRILMCPHCHAVLGYGTLGR